MTALIGTALIGIALIVLVIGGAAFLITNLAEYDDVRNNFFRSVKNFLKTVICIFIGYLLGNAYPTFKVVGITEASIVVTDALPVADHLKFNDEEMEK